MMSLDFPFKIKRIFPDISIELVVDATARHCDGRSGFYDSYEVEASTPLVRIYGAMIELKIPCMIPNPYEVKKTIIHEMNYLIEKYNLVCNSRDYSIGGYIEGCNKMRDVLDTGATLELESNTRDYYVQKNVQFSTLCEIGLR